MSGLSGIFDIGKLGLLANQRALQVVSQNLANVNTPGYSRQEAVFEQTLPGTAGTGQIGTGVQVAQIRRLTDSFIENQVNLSQQDLGRLQAQVDTFLRLEGIFPDSNDQGLNEALNDFFNALRDVSNNPGGQTERTVLLERAGSLAALFNKTANDLTQMRKDLNAQVSQTITEVNNLASQIAELNGKIAAAELGGQPANDLRDQRGKLLNDLGKDIEIHTFEDTQGRAQVFVGRGQLLVEQTTRYALAGIASPDNSGFLAVGYDNQDISSFIGNGALNGLLALRDTTIPDVLDRVNTLAAALVNEVNQLHRAGFGLDGTTGNDFFSPLSVTATAASANGGSLAVTGTISTASSLTFHAYTLTFGAAGAYTITDQTTKAAVSSGTYTGPGPTTLSAFDGLTLTFSGATPASGDTFTISAHKDAAKSLAVALTSGNKVAASATQAGVPGDNTTALALVALQNKSITALGSTTLNTYYSTTASEVGADALVARQDLDAQETVQQTLDDLRGEVSGVSTDEELTNMIKFQRAYQAAARVIVVADELFQTLLDLKR